MTERASTQTSPLSRKEADALAMRQFKRRIAGMVIGFGIFMIFVGLALSQARIDDSNWLHLNWWYVGIGLAGAGLFMQQLSTS